MAPQSKTDPAVKVVRSADSYFVEEVPASKLTLRKKLKLYAELQRNGIVPNISNFEWEDLGLGRHLATAAICYG